MSDKCIPQDSYQNVRHRPEAPNKQSTQNSQQNPNLPGYPQEDTNVLNERNEDIGKLTYIIPSIYYP